MSKPTSALLRGRYHLSSGLRFSEVSDSFVDRIVPTGKAAPTGRGLGDRPDDQRVGEYCPHCRQIKQGAKLSEDDANLYPWHFTDGTRTYINDPAWRARREPGVPSSDTGDVAAWEAMLLKRGLLLDRVLVRPTVERLRQKWEAEQAERRRREEEERRARQKEESDRRLALIQLADNVARGAGRVKVAVERSDYDYADVDSIQGRTTSPCGMDTDPVCGRSRRPGDFPGTGRRRRRSAADPAGVICS